MPESVLNQRVLKGRVVGGYGTASLWGRGPGPISDVLGAFPYPGSLNIALDQPVRFRPEHTAIPQEGRIYYWEAKISGFRCLIARRNSYALHFIEVIAERRLRDELQLSDKSIVEIQVSAKLIDPLSWSTKLVWYLFWGMGRTTWVVSRRYRLLVGPLWLLRRKATQFPEYRIKLFRKLRFQSVSICHINLARNPKLRGGERQTEILVRALAKKGVFRQRVVVLRHGPLARRINETENVEVLLARSRLAALFLCRGASLLHSHEAHAAQVAHAASLIWRSKYLITRRLTKPVGGSLLSSAIYRKAQTVITLTDAVEQGVRQRFPKISTNRISDAWNPRETDLLGAAKIREKFPDKFLIGYMAAMDDPEKGHAVLIQAAQLLAEDFPDLQFLLLGAGRMEEQLRQQAEGFSNVYFAGWIEDPWAWMDALDLFAFPSLVESLGSTLLDAMHSGIPIVASQVGGIPEVVTDECGLLIPPNNAEVLAQQIIRLYKSPKLREKYARAGIERAKQYDPALIAQQHIDVYQILGTNLE